MFCEKILREKSSKNKILGSPSKNNKLLKIFDVFNIIDCIEKKVTFSTIIRVILIPSRSEYFESFLDTLVWWKEEDYIEFKQNFLLELNIVI